MKAAEMLDRRRVLRGMLAGASVYVGLPILDCLLNTNGTAFAATGRPIPPRFGTWFWGLGLGESSGWVPKTTGSSYELPHSLGALKPFQSKINLFSGTNVNLDGQTNNTHFTGVQAQLTGSVSASRGYNASIDNVIGDVIGSGTRFRSITVTCDGDPGSSWSSRPEGGRVPSEVSPLALYTRIFGPEFTDPNSAEFVPDPAVMVRRSALSAITEERKALMSQLGASDKQKLDNYFTSLRGLEQRLAIQLQKPEPLPACTKPSEPEPEKEQRASLLTDAMRRHDLFAGLMAHALACGQTRVVNLSITEGMAGLRHEGDPISHHTYTHEEPVDKELGYQPKCATFESRYMQALHDFMATLDAIKEGDKSLLDRMVIYAFTDHGAPRLHSLRNFPAMTLGDGDGRLKTGMHIALPNEPATRMTLTVQQAMGVAIGSFGEGSNQATRSITEILGPTAG
jgi:hypothetical protein